MRREPRAEVVVLMAKRKSAKPPAIGLEPSAEERTVVTAQKPGSPAINPENLIGQAIKAKVPIETLEKLLAMRRELRAEWAREQYFAALALFQAACPIIARTKVVLNTDDTERYRYAPIEAIVKQVGPLLRDHGFSYTTKTDQGDASVTAITEAHHRDGHMEVTTIRMPIDPAPGMNKSQATVSAFTYARRVSFCGAFGIMTAEDDDDGTGSGDEEKPGKQPVADPPRMSQRNVTPGVTAKPAPDQVAARKLPEQLTGIKAVGAECYWLLKDAHDAKLLSDVYCSTQGKRMQTNKGNEQFLVSLKIEIEAKIEEATKTTKGSAA